jgi:hypothetical protein
MRSAINSFLAHVNGVNLLVNRFGSFLNCRGRRSLGGDGELSEMRISSSSSWGEHHASRTTNRGLRFLLTQEIVIVLLFSCVVGQGRGEEELLASSSAPAAASFHLATRFFK